MWKGKKVSILGDSISTYRGVSNDTGARQDIGENPFRYQLPFPLEKTYWQRVINHFGMELCVNNSWSGGNLTGFHNPDAGVNRSKRLAKDDGTTPDLVLLFMGINDLGRGVDVKLFFVDYLHTLENIRQLHPNAQICCINLPDRDPRLKMRSVAFNATIADAVAKMGEGVFIADLFGSKLNNDFYYDNTTDGLHPDEDGMRYIAEVIIDAISNVESVV